MHKQFVDQLCCKLGDMRRHHLQGVKPARAEVDEVVEIVASEIYGCLDSIAQQAHYQLFTDFIWDQLGDCNELRTALRKSNLEAKICFRVLNKIYNTDPSYRNWEHKEEQVRKLLALSEQSSFQWQWQQTIPAAVKNLIFNNKGNLDIRVKSLRDLKRVIESWQSLGLTLFWKDVAKEIEKEFHRKDYAEVVKERVNKIIGPLQSYVRSLEGLEYNDGTIVTHTRAQLAHDLNRRKTRDRCVLDGRHLRDYQMTRYFKAMKHFRCDLEGEDCYGAITLHHIIPLHLGIELGAIDHPVNYQVLCELHHEEVETDLLLRLCDLNENEKLRWLETQFPKIISAAQRVSS